MRKVLLISAFIVSISITAFTQPSKAVEFGAGLRFGLPIGDFEEFTSFGIGAELQGEYKFSGLLSALGTVGYTHFLGKDYGAGKTKGTGYIPILLGARLYPVNRIFLGAQIGYGILAGGGSADGAFNYQPHIGYNASKFQFAFNYNGLSEKGSTFSHLTLTAIFKFGGN